MQPHALLVLVAVAPLGCGGDAMSDNASATGMMGMGTADTAPNQGVGGAEGGAGAVALGAPAGSGDAGARELAGSMAAMPVGIAQDAGDESDGGTPAHDAAQVTDGGEPLAQTDAGPAVTLETRCRVAVDLLAGVYPTAVAATAEEVEAQMCLIDWFDLLADPVLGEACLEQARERGEVSGTGERYWAPSRIAEPDGQGGCRFANECAQDSDCVVANDLSRCCPPGPWPSAAVEAEPCLTLEHPPVDHPSYLACMPWACGPAGFCGYSGEPSCVEEDGLRVCR